MLKIYFVMGSFSSLFFYNVCLFVDNLILTNVREAVIFLH